MDFQDGSNRRMVYIPYLSLTLSALHDASASVKFRRQRLKDAFSLFFPYACQHQKPHDVANGAQTGRIAAWNVARSCANGGECTMWSWTRPMQPEGEQLS